MKFDKGDLKTGLIVLTFTMIALAGHQMFVAPKIAARARKS